MNAPRIPLVPATVRWLLVGAIAVVILVASLSPTGASEQIHGPFGAGLDKYLHALGFGGFALGLSYALATRDARRATVVVLAGAVAFGLAIEVLQFGLPYRTFSWLDLLADGVGATVVAAGWYVVADRLRFRRVSLGSPVDE